MRFSLDGKWKINHLEYGADLSPVLAPDFVPEGWLAAQVPEEIHAVLRRYGLIKGHVFHKSFQDEEWIEQVDWVYYKEFYLPAETGDNLELCCEGLDTFCELYLNGTHIGDGCNMFRTFRKDVAGIVRPGARNTLVIRFLSPVRAVEGMSQEGIFSTTTSDRILARKAQMNYSWDFCGRCVTVGIWKPVYLRERPREEIRSWYVSTLKIRGDTAMLRLRADLALGGAEQEAGVTAASPVPAAREPAKGQGPAAPVSAAPAAAQSAGKPGGTCGEYRLRVLLSKDGEIRGEWLLPAQESREAVLSVDRPSLWWPHLYGEPFLYDFELQLLCGEEILDRKTQKLGIRTIELLQEPQPDGRSFCFAVNGRRLFIRGANWVPMRMIYTDLCDEDYDRYLRYAVHGNVCMLRVWGGGIYESERFYYQCDELGILVWNDFMLACGVYPQDEAFLDNVREEAKEAVLRMRNRACLAIWSGDNENGQAYGWGGRPYEFTKDRIGNEVLREVCDELDPDRVYLPTSPCSPFEKEKGGDNPGSAFQGDQHIYIMSSDPGRNERGDYGRNYYKRILTYRPRFVSEFGFISLPEKDTFYQFNFLREPLCGGNEMESHFPPAGRYVKEQDYDRAVYYAQLFQAEALKYWIEYFRSLKGTCQGSLYWKFNDPTADCPKDMLFPSHMSTVDMYGRPKMSYYYTRRAYADLILAFVEGEDGLEICACNERLTPAKGVLRVEELNLQGGGRVLFEEESFAAPDASTRLCVIGKDQMNRTADRYIRVSFTCGEETVQNRFWYAELNDCDQIPLPEPGLVIERAEMTAPGELTVRIGAERFARNVRLYIPDVHAFYSDNYFDLEGGSSREIRITLFEESRGTDLRETVLSAEAEKARRVVRELCRC